MNQYIELESRFGAHNYKPLPLVLNRAKGCHVWDTDGNRYLDMMSAYSAVSHGHAHPRILDAVRKQAAQLSVVSRAFYSDNLGAFLQKACEVTGMDKALPMNSGAEAVETSLKAARKWAYQVKGVEADKAEIISCRGNFHGRTLAVLTMSTEEQYRNDYGPFLPGFRNIEFGNTEALRSAISANTAAFIVEPIQGEGGIIIPPDGYLTACAEICREHNVLLIFDEIQTGLGRTGKLLACDHDEVRPDGLILGKALGGGLYPISLFLSRSDIMDCFKPGDHGSTFGGNALAAAIGLEALMVLEEEGLVENSQRMGEYFINGLRRIDSPLVSDIRGKGLFIGMEIDPAQATARSVCEQLMKHGVLSKETHETVVRFAPPLIISKEDIDQALEAIETALKEVTEQSEKIPDIEVFENNEKHYQAFIDLNEQWITTFFEIEEVDRKLAANPYSVVTDGGYIFSLVSESEVVGVCALFNDGDGVYELARMAVNPEYQGRKFGDRLLQVALGKLSEIGASRVYLLSNKRLTKALSLYRKHGFKTMSEEAHPVYTRCDITMERKISSVT